jgi:CRP-like cAMP-binding protein
LAIQQKSIRNRLLQALTPHDFALVADHVERTPLDRAEVLDPGALPARHIYFPESGVMSVIAITGGGRRIEVGLFGRDGVSNPHLLLGVDRSPHETIAQVAGEAYRMPAEAMHDIATASPSLKALLLKYVQAFTVQTAHTALSNGSYKIEERLARWLLMCHDRIDGDEVHLTHEFLAVMLGVRRSGVTLAIHMLEGGRLIKGDRGKITILDRSGLEGAAGDSYGLPEAEYERILGRFR